MEIDLLSKSDGIYMLALGPQTKSRQEQSGGSGVVISFVIRLLPTYLASCFRLSIIHNECGQLMEGLSVTVNKY